MVDATEMERRIAAAAGFLARRFGACPPVAIVAGTGLGRLGRGDGDGRGCPYGEIPGFPVSTAPGHRGELLLAHVGGLPTLVFQGRFHLYEGHAPQDLVLPFRAVFRWGVRGLIVTNAAGGLDLRFRAGEMMLITDHINAMGDSALVGPHLDAWGPRFPDLSCAYDPALRALALGKAAELGLRLHQGVYVAVRGPCLETPAETRFYRQMGADAIGMSTVQEVMAARQAGVRVLAFSAITNVNDPDRMAPATIEDILAAADRAAGDLARLIAAVRPGWPAA